MTCIVGIETPSDVIMGGDFALGNLWATRGKDPEARIMQAPDAAGQFSNGVCGPYYVEEQRSEHAQKQR